MCLLLCTGLVQAQEAPHVSDLGTTDTSTIARNNSAAISLERNLNTFNWIGRAVVNDTTAWGTIVRLNEQYTSNVILLDGGTSTSQRKLQSTQQNHSLILMSPLVKDLASQVQWTSLVYSDNKSVGLRTATFHSLLGGLEYHPIEFLSLTPLVGYRWDNQAGVRDRGPSYTLAGQIYGIDMDGYQLTGAAQFHEDRLNPRVLQRHFAHVGAQKYFSGNTHDSLEIGYRRNRREFYNVADGNIESRIENVFSFFNFLNYELDNNFSALLFVSVANRSLDKDLRHFSATPDTVVRFNTAIDEFRLDSYVGAAYRSDEGGLLGSLRLSHTERNELHSAKPIPGAPPP
ncbi:MAG: hypothetical protein AAB393_15600, partial [Bacteroidota bacterium]